MPVLCFIKVRYKNSLYPLPFNPLAEPALAFASPAITVIQFPTVAESDKTWIRAIRDGFVSGAVASIASTIALLLLGRFELGRWAAPVNGPSQWIWGKYAPYENRFSLRYTIVGYAVHHAASVFWAILFEKLRQRLSPDGKPEPVLVPAAVISTAAYTIDFHLTPERLTPGFQHRLSNHSLLIVYVTFGLGLAAAGLMGDGRGRRKGCRGKAP